MRGIGVTEFGGPEALQVLDLPEDHAGARRSAYPRARRDGESN